jgi:hypothetical protein
VLRQNNVAADDVHRNRDDMLQVGTPQEWPSHAIFLGRQLSADDVLFLSLTESLTEEQSYESSPLHPSQSSQSSTMACVI